MSAAARLWDEAWREGLAPEPQLTVSEWADAHRVLPAASAEPGRWRTDRAPFLREPMDCLSTSSPIERVVIVKAAQVGGTEISLNLIGYIVAHAPGIVLAVMPSVDMARRNVRSRIDPLIEATPAIRASVVPARAREPGNTGVSKRFRGGELIATGANSAAALRSTPARFVILDEVDAFPLDVEGEGDPVALAIARTATFKNRKILMISTPTIKDVSRIEAAYAETDQRRYFVPCPQCGGMQVLEWARIVWPEGEPAKAHAVCEHCGEAIAETHKARMLAAGEWRATAQGDGKSAGFHISGLYSPFVSWGEIAAQFLAAKRDPARLKVWCNTALGESWDEGQNTIEPEALQARAEDWGDELPAGVVCITAGVDVQDDRLEIELVGWGAGEESWSLAYHVLYGDPARDELWAQLDALLLQRWRHRRVNADLPVRAACIDSGGHFTGRVVEFAAARAQRRVWAIKGASGPGKPPWPRKPSRSAKTKQPLYVIGTDALKEAFAARLAIADEGPGYCHFPLGRDDAYFSQLTSERLVTKYVRGRASRLWTLPKDRRNEALDCRVYAMSALEALKQLGFRLDAETQRIAAAPPRVEGDATQAPARAAPRVIRSKWMDR